MNTLIQFFEEMYEDQSGVLGRVKRYILKSEFNIVFDQRPHVTQENASFFFSEKYSQNFFIGGGECDFYLGHLLSHGWCLNKSAQNITLVNVNV